MKISHPDINSDREFLKIKTRDDQKRELQNKTEKHDDYNISDGLENYKDYNKKKYTALKKKKVLLKVIELLIGSASSKGSSTIAILNLSAGIIISYSTALLTNIAILITNENLTNLKCDTSNYEIGVL